MAKYTKTPVAKVPRANILGTYRTPKGFVPAQRPPNPRLQAVEQRRKQQRQYSKTSNQDPMQYTSFGFGDTGMTGES